MANLLDTPVRRKKEKELFNDFKAFLLKQNALALAVAVIIGTAIGKVVTSLVEDVINPLLGRLLPGGDWRNARIVLGSAVEVVPGERVELLFGEGSEVENIDGAVERVIPILRVCPCAGAK